MMKKSVKGAAIREVAPHGRKYAGQQSPLPRVLTGAGKWWKMGKINVLWSG